MIARRMRLSGPENVYLATADGLGAEGIARSAPAQIVTSISARRSGLTGPWAHAPATRFNIMRGVRKPATRGPGPDQPPISNAEGRPNVPSGG